MFCILMFYNWKIVVKSIKNINASMSSVKISEKLIDRKLKGYFEKVNLQSKKFYQPLEWQWKLSGIWDYKGRTYCVA
jgi:hypothetical protein